MSQLSTFEDLISKHPSYGKLVDVKGSYQVWAVHTEMHWFLMIKGDRPDLPFITFEIRTEDFADIVPTVRDVQVDCHDQSLPHPENVGTYGPNNVLRDLCKMADKVAKEMGDYNLLNNNCQHFSTTYWNEWDSITHSRPWLAQTRLFIKRSQIHWLLPLVKPWKKWYLLASERWQQLDWMTLGEGVPKVYMP